MPKLDPAVATHWVIPGIGDDYTQEIGDFTITKEVMTVDMDYAFAFKGLPDDMCQASHFGYVISGALTVRNTDGTEEVFHAGDAYVLSPGHVPSVAAGTEFVSFTPTAEDKAQADVVMANMMRRAAEMGITIPS